MIHLQMIGYDMCLFGSILANAEFVKKFGRYDSSVDAWTLPADWQLVWTLVQFFCAISGSFIVGSFSDWLGRRAVFFSIVILALLGTTVELVSPDWKVWIVAKVIFGIAMGFMLGSTPAYVSEVAPVKIRGSMLSLFQFWMIVGVFIASCVLEGTSNITGQWSWKSAIITQYGVGLFSFIFFICFVPESPYYLADRDRVDAARAALLRIHGNEANYDVEADLEVILNTLEHERQQKSDQGTWLEIFKGTDLKRTLIAVLPQAMQQFGGSSLCGNYLAYFLAIAGFSKPFLVTVVTNLLSIFAVLFAFVLIERLGRRQILLGGTAGMVVCLLAVGICGFINYGSKSNGTALAAFCILWSLFYYASVGAVGWTLTGEISSARLRAKTSAFSGAMNSVIGMIFSMSISYLINKENADLGAKAGLVFCGCLTTLGAVAFFMVPETKNRTFEELDYLFEAKVAPRKFRSTVIDFVARRQSV